MSCDGQGLDSDTEYPMYDVTDVLPTDTCTSTIRVVKRVKFSLPHFRRSYAVPFDHTGTLLKATGVRTGYIFKFEALQRGER